jgi:hypothetical protein
MIPGVYDLPIVENADSTLTVVISGITTIVGYTAAVDIRILPKHDATLILGLTHSSGITLTTDGTDLTASIAITAAQSRTLADILRSQSLFWSLRLTIGGIATQYLNGNVVLTGTPTV